MFISFHAKCCFIPLVIGNGVHYASDSITPALWLLCKRYVYKLNTSLQNNIVTCILLLCSCICYTGIQGLNYPELPSRGILGNKEIILFDCTCELCGYE